MINVAVVGASPKSSRYSNLAITALAGGGFNPIPVTPAWSEILGLRACPALADLPERIDTITMYIRPSLQPRVLDEAVAIKPRRIIFNPGTENPSEYNRLRDAGIEVIEACTLVMLMTKQF